MNDSIAGMRKDDARKLDHKTLEAIREHAVRRVQEGESPEVAARIFGVGRTAIYGMAGALPAGRLERPKSQASSWAPPET